MPDPNSSEIATADAELDADPPEATTGRPTVYRAEFADQARKLCLLGATDIEIADFFNVDRATVYRWKNTRRLFCDALKAGKAQADQRVERSLYAKATGYTHDAVKIFQNEGVPVIVPFREHVPPDTTACIFWLKNRKPKEWRDVQQHKLDVETTKNFTFTIKPQGHGIAEKHASVEADTQVKDSRMGAVSASN